ncbi:hypothetical protein D3C73_708590 [compost metagenome]
MYLGQQLHVQRIRHLPDPAEKLVNLRFHKKTTGPQFLDNIPDSIQPYNLDVLRLEILKK